MSALTNDNEEVEPYFQEYEDFSTWQWSTTEVVSTESGSISFDSAVKVDKQGNVHVIWADYTNYGGSGSDTDIFYKYWDSSTRIWTITEVVSTESTIDSQYPEIAVDILGNVYVVWEDGTDFAGSGGTDWDIFFKYRDSNTGIWSITEVVSLESTNDSYNPNIEVDSVGNVYVVWYDRTNLADSGDDYDIFYRYREKYSGLWSTVEVVSTESTEDSINPSIALDSAGNRHVVWVDFTDYEGCGTDSDIFYKYWDSGLESWSFTQVVSTVSNVASVFPTIAVNYNDGSVHIAWNDYMTYGGSGSDLDIYYRNYSPTKIWSETYLVSTESNLTSEKASISTDLDGNLHIVWEDLTNYADSGGDRDIFAKHWFIDSIANWSLTEVVSTESTGSSYYADISIDLDGSVYVVWQDVTDYLSCGVDTDIFFKKYMGPPVSPPDLAYIVPNPSTTGEIILDWNNVARATEYYVYRSISYIWSITGLTPLDMVVESTYTENIDLDGFYYYVVVAGNFVKNTVHSNCQYVEIRITGIEPPELAIITPNPTDTSSVYLYWNDVIGASEYYIYRSSAYIWSVDGLTPITTTDIRYYIDTLPAEGHFFYVIVATDGVHNSTHSNCEFVYYSIPHLREFAITTSLIIGTTMIFIISRRIPKRKTNYS